MDILENQNLRYRYRADESFLDEKWLQVESSHPEKTYSPAVFGTTSEKSCNSKVEKIERAIQEETNLEHDCTLWLIVDGYFEKDFRSLHGSDQSRRNEQVKCSEVNLSSQRSLLSLMIVIHREFIHQPKRQIGPATNSEHQNQDVDRSGIECSR